MVNIDHPLFGGGVAVLINLSHNGAQVHWHEDNLVVVRHLGWGVWGVEFTQHLSVATCGGVPTYLLWVDWFHKLLKLPLSEQLVGCISQEYPQLS